MTQWPGDGSLTSACVGCFEAWGQTPAGVARREMVGTAEDLEGITCAQHYSGFITTLFNIHNRPTMQMLLYQHFIEKN